MYGLDEVQFFQALCQAGVDTFCDLRYRRGMRGARYAFANANYLQQRLAAMSIRYLHCKDVAPDDALRNQQQLADARAGVGKRSRTRLSAAFSEAYLHSLGSFSAAQFLERLPPGARVLCLFCVEQEPDACHRSLFAARLAADLGVQVEHLRP